MGSMIKGLKDKIKKKTIDNMQNFVGTKSQKVTARVDNSDNLNSAQVNSMDKIKQNTLLNLQKYVGTRIRGQIYTAEQAKIDADNLILFLQSFLGELERTGLIDSTETKTRIEKMIWRNVLSIDFLPESERGLYGKTNPDEHKIYINPELDIQKRTLYLFHELAHCCFEDVETIDDIPAIGDYKRFSTYYGYMVIEEALAQNIAETCFYHVMDKPRPAKQESRDSIIPGVPFFTNFDYYGLYQPLATLFGRTLRGVGKSTLDRDDRVLFQLSKKALKENLLKSVVDEYTKDGIADELELTFFKLANIYSAKKKSFGAGWAIERVFDKNGKCIKEKELNTTKENTANYYIDVLNQMIKNEDYRPVLNNIFERTTSR